MEKLSAELRKRLAEYGELVINGRLYVADAPAEQPAEPPADATEETITDERGE